MARCSPITRLVREIGRGAMGAVYLAEDLALERQVAVKVLLPEHAVHPGQAALFRREARLWRLSGMKTSSMHTLGEHRSIPYMVMEYIVGRRWRTYLRAGGAGCTMRSRSIWRSAWRCSSVGGAGGSRRWNYPPRH